MWYGKYTIHRCPNSVASNNAIPILKWNYMKDKQRGELEDFGHVLDIDDVSQS